MLEEFQTGLLRHFLNIKKKGAMNTRNQLLCVWSGLAFVLIFMLGFWPLAHFVPPPSPTVTAADIVRIYQTNTWQIRLGLMMMGCSGLIAPFVAVI